MPCYKCSNGTWRIGTGKCQYPDKKTREKALRGYHASKAKKSNKKED